MTMIKSVTKNMGLCPCFTIKRKIFYQIKIEESKPIAPLLYPNITSFSEQYINYNILAKNNVNNNINILKGIRNYYETETNFYNKK